MPIRSYGSTYNSIHWIQLSPLQSSCTNKTCHWEKACNRCSWAAKPGQQLFILLFAAHLELQAHSHRLLLQERYLAMLLRATDEVRNAVHLHFITKGPKILCAGGKSDVTKWEKNNKDRLSKCCINKDETKKPYQKDETVIIFSIICKGIKCAITGGKEYNEVP